MRLSRLDISNVRNIASMSIDCNPSLNLFVGPNGAGKSAILESIFLVSRGRSFRSASAMPVVRDGSSSLKISAHLIDEHRGNVVVRLVRHSGGRRELQLSERPEKRISEVARLMPIQLMLPDASSVVFGAPEERRRLLDWGVFHVKPLYLDALRNFQRALQQRNSSLRAARGRELNLGPESAVWMSRLIELALVVDQTRRWYFDQLLPTVSLQLQSLAPDLNIGASYYSGWPEASDLRDSMSESLPRDVKSGTTTYGPHRADIRLDVGLRSAAGTLSRGQAKVVASALRLAQAQLTSELGGRRSLFLIDDVGAELDQAHNERFFAALEKLDCQVFATATAPPRLATSFVGSKRWLFHVEQGSCHEIDTKE